MTTEEEISNFKYHSAQVVALSSGEVAMIGAHTNYGGLPFIDIFSSFEDLHKALWDFQNRPWRHKYEPAEPKVRVSLESLGLAKPMKRRALNGA